MAPVTPRVSVVTAGHLSTCPRMLKAADALHERGYDVSVVSARHTQWASAADATVASRREWRWAVVDYSRDTGRRTRVTTGLRRRAAITLARSLGPSHVPFEWALRAYSRAHDELVDAIASEPADFVYGGTTGALAAVADAAARLRVPYALDLEDFHSAEQTGPGSELAHALAQRIEREVLRDAAFLTAGSPMIADRYAATYGMQPIAIHNTFSIGFSADADVSAGRPLRMYWFSQTLGADRGLEDVIRAVGRARVAAELHLRAWASESSLADLVSLQQSVAPTLAIVHHEPASPDDMVTLAHGYDLGLSCEMPAVLNRQLCLTNKIFTYLAAGVPMVLSATPAQARLAGELGPAALVYEPGDVDGLAEQIRRWTADPAARNAARLAARAAAERRWHWEHPDDRGALLAAVHRLAPTSVQQGWREQPCAS